MGADACGAELNARWAPHHRMVNFYGPTEATVAATRSAPLRADGAAPPIGRPLPVTGAYVLDARLRPVPDGVAGELWLAGPALALRLPRPARADCGPVPRRPVRPARYPHVPHRRLRCAATAGANSLPGPHRPPAESRAATASRRARSRRSWSAIRACWTPW
ncbi:AMP-binding protein [Streptomyces tricolor]|nr:AMP-binding protein [Streptomyces tricolor]